MRTCLDDPTVAALTGVGLMATPSLGLTRIIQQGAEVAVFGRCS